MIRKMPSSLSPVASVLARIQSVDAGRDDRRTTEIRVRGITPGVLDPTSICRDDLDARAEIIAARGHIFPNHRVEATAGRAVVRGLALEAAVPHPGRSGGH